MIVHRQVAPRRDAAIRTLRWSGLGEGAIATAAIAAAWALVLASSTGGPVESLRSLAFMGGPFLLLAGLHARLSGYLHSRRRLDLLPRPITPSEHWRLARGRHRRGFVWVVLLGTAAILVGVGPSAPRSVVVALLADLGWLLLIAALVEPSIAALAAWFGRRFAADTTVAELQRTLASGWTAPEAAVHLYVPAIGIAVAVALAMPAQLALELRGPALSALPFALVPLAIAGGLRLLAPRLYSSGVWEAVPRIHEVSRTLAGPPDPPPAPSWIRRAPAMLRLDLLQLTRIRALLWLRLLAILGASAWLLAMPTASAAALAIGIVSAGLWIGPFAALHRQRDLRARLLAALPVEARHRRGAPSPATLLLAAAPVCVLLLAAFV